MSELEKSLVISNAEYAKLIAAESKAEMLGRILHKKLKSYSGINSKELEDICVMAGIIEPKDDDR